MSKWRGSERHIVAGLAVLLVPLTGSGCADAKGPKPPRGATPGDGTDVGSTVCLVGRSTAEGVECQAFRGSDGRLYTLIGELGGLAADRDVCVCGEPVEISTCMQGTTVAVTGIGPPGSCP